MTNHRLEMKRKVNIYRRYFLWKKAGCVFIHVPKVAGTSINQAIYGRPMGHYTAMEVRNSFPGLFNNLPVFTLVRNPWSRAVSAWRFACLGKTNVMGIHNPEQYQIPEFSSFERFLLDWLQKKDVLKLDFVFRPQYLFICDEKGDVLVDHLGRLEELPETKRYMEEHLEITKSIGMANSSMGETDYRCYYHTYEMIDAVRRVYDADITKFNYDFD